jgi:WD40 repeat protein
MVRLWELGLGKEIRKFEEQPRAVYSVAFSPDSKTLATGSFAMVRLWDAATGKEIRHREIHQSRRAFDDKITSLSFSPDRKTLAFGVGMSDSRMVGEGYVGLWDVGGGKKLRIWTGDKFGVNAVVFSPNGKTLASCGMDKKVVLWTMPATKQEDR